MYVPYKIGQPKNILIRAHPWGDLLTAVPAFRALRSALPDARITLISLPPALEFVKRLHAYLDDFIPFPGFPGFSDETANVRSWAFHRAAIIWSSLSLRQTGVSCRR